MVHYYRNSVTMQSQNGSQFFSNRHLNQLSSALRPNKHGRQTTIMPRPFFTHTHIRLTALFPGLPGWAGTRKVKPIWILLKQETVSGSGISWDICKSAPYSRQITTPTPHHCFLQAGCPSCRPTNSVKALKHDHALVNTLSTGWHADRISLT